MGEDSKSQQTSYINGLFAEWQARPHAAEKEVLRLALEAFHPATRTEWTWASQKADALGYFVLFEILTERYLATTPDDADVLCAKIRKIMPLPSRREEGLVLAERVHDLPNLSSDNLVVVGYVFRVWRRRNASLACFAAAITLNPKNFNARRSQVEALLFFRLNWKARLALRAMLKAGPVGTVWYATIASLAASGGFKKLAEAAVKGFFLAAPSADDEGFVQLLQAASDLGSQPLASYILEQIEVADILSLPFLRRLVGAISIDIRDTKFFTAAAAREEVLVRVAQPS